MINVFQARQLTGSTVHLCWQEAGGLAREATTEVHCVEYLPIVGPCLVTAVGDVPLHRVTHAAPTVPTARAA